MSDVDTISVVFERVVDLAAALGVRDIGKRDTPWVYAVDENWTIAVNGTKTEKEVEPEDTMGAKLQPYEMGIWWNGWLAGIANPHGGLIAGGEMANEDTFCAAVQRQTERLKEE